jgi:hypothetical protein
MGRKSKLTEDQWSEIEQRHLKGEAMRALAREFKIDPASISARISQRVKQTKTLANQLATAELAVERLPISQRMVIRTVADDLKVINTNMAAAGALSSGTSRILSQIANEQALKIDMAEPFGDIELLKGVTFAQKGALEAAQLPAMFMTGKADPQKVLGTGDEDEDTAMGGLHLIRARKAAREKGTA